MPNSTPRRHRVPRIGPGAFATIRKSGRYGTLTSSGMLVKRSRTQGEQVRGSMLAGNRAMGFV